jgi:hypothetical protein
MADEMKRGPGRPPKPPLQVVDGGTIKLNSKDGSSVSIDPAGNVKIATGNSLPASVTLEHPYAYYAGDGLMRAWPAGLVVTDPIDIADLIARKAPLKG